MLRFYKSLLTYFLSSSTIIHSACNSLLTSISTCPLQSFILSVTCCWLISSRPLLLIILPFCDLLLTNISSCPLQPLSLSFYDSLLTIISYCPFLDLYSFTHSCAVTFSFYSCFFHIPYTAKIYIYIYIYITLYFPWTQALVLVTLERGIRHRTTKTTTPIESNSYSTFNLNTIVHLRHKTGKCFGYRAQPSSSCLEELCGLRYKNLTDVIYKYIKYIM